MKNKNSMLKPIIFIISISLLITGCVGIGVVHSKDRQSECENQYTRDYTLNYLNKIYGEAKSISVIDKNTTTYLYTIDNMAWRGVIPMIGIGIPFVLPIGTDYYEITYTDDKCIKTKEEYTEWSGYMCGYVNENGKKDCVELGK